LRRQNNYRSSATLSFTTTQTVSIKRSLIPFSACSSPDTFPQLRYNGIDCLGDFLEGEVHSRRVRLQQRFSACPRRYWYLYLRNDGCFMPFHALTPSKPSFPMRLKRFRALFCHKFLRQIERHVC
jgi:hypothetical protein